MSVKFRVLSYNIHKGFGLPGFGFLLDRIRAGIREVGADVVMLQEVSGENSRHRERVAGWPRTSQLEFLADEVWPHYAYGKNALYPEGHHGNALMSRFPIQGHGNVDLSNHRLERRGLLWAEVVVPGRGLLRLATVHLDLTEWGRERQRARIVEELRARWADGGPGVLTGDFNDWREKCTEPLREGLGLEEAFLSLSGGHVRTFPAILPAFRLDRVYSRGLRVVAASALDGPQWRKLSDHVPLCVTFEWNL
ncbi:MAG: endonuclease/exonuclease/phosphatase family protein [Bdellovibrionales bacterium]|nr:endonuclease/exonuclease/phosphatase family protein [Bdellovibrionales bacterium]